MLLFSSCGNNNQQGSDAATATAVTTSETALIQTGDTLSAVRANDGTNLWTLKKSAISRPLAVIKNQLYYGTSSNIAAVDLASGKQLWSEPISGDAIDLQASSTLVYVLNVSLSSTGVLSAFDANTGTLKWHIANVGMYTLSGTGETGGNGSITGGKSGSSFIISGNTIYTAISGVLAALNASTGSQMWQFTPSTLNNSNIGGLVLSADGKTLYVSYINVDAIYAVDTSTHQEVWHLDPTTTSTDQFTGDVSTSQDMNLSWFTVTPDSHVLFSASFNSSDNNSNAQAPQDGYHYLGPDGKELWSLPLSAQNRVTNEGDGESLLVGDSAFYTIGGPSGGDVSATALSNQKQIWNTPSSGSYGQLYLDNDVLLASSGASIVNGGGAADGHTLTAFNTQNGKQLWQLQVQANNMGIQEIFPVGQHVFIEEWGQTAAENPTIIVFDLHSGKKLWSMPTPVGSGQYTYWAKPLQNVIQTTG